MLESPPKVLALDFDGVLCDGLREYFQTAWQAYTTLWPSISSMPPTGLAERFYQLRPVVETGWEMPVLIHALLQGVAEAEILQDWPTIARLLLVDNRLQAADVGAKVDEIRDRWIATDLDGWLALHRFYPGVIDQLRQFVTRGSVQPVIVTTKEGRFVAQLLQQEGIELPADQILGKEVKRPKYQILRELWATAQLQDGADLWFIEDRLKTLLTVQEQEDLTSVQLFLADWGYNTARDRTLAEQDHRIHLLSLQQFGQDFSAWA